MSRQRTFRTLLAALAVTALAACGGGESAPEPAAEQATPTPAGQPAPPTAAAATGDTITIRMVTTQNGAAGVFEPAAVTAKPGDVLHFVADGGAAHNVSWPPAENPAGATLPPPSAYVVAAEQAVDQTVGMAPGTYNFQCDPHAPMGMKGTLTVTG